MSSSTEQRPHTTGPTPTADDITVAIPRPVGPWGAQSPFASQAPRASAPGWPAPAPWTVPPAGMAPLGPGVPVPARSGMRWGWVVIAVVAAIAAVMLIGTVAANNRTLTVSGTVTIYGMSGYVSPGSGCTSTRASGMPVMIYNAAGSLVGSTSLTGTGIARNTWSSSYYGYSDSCEYAFTISDVAASDDYRVTTGSSSGDGVGFSREQIESSGADITLR